MRFKFQAIASMLYENCHAIAPGSVAISIAWFITIKQYVFMVSSPTFKGVCDGLVDMI